MHEQLLEGRFIAMPLDFLYHSHDLAQLPCTTYPCLPLLNHQKIQLIKVTILRHHLSRLKLIQQRKLQLKTLVQPRVVLTHLYEHPLSNYTLTTQQQTLSVFLLSPLHEFLHPQQYQQSYI